MPIALTRN